MDPRLAARNMPDGPASSSSDASSGSESDGEDGAIFERHQHYFSMVDDDDARNGVDEEDDDSSNVPTGAFLGEEDDNDAVDQASQPQRQGVQVRMEMPSSSHSDAPMPHHQQQQQHGSASSATHHRRQHHDHPFPQQSNAPYVPPTASAPVTSHFDAILECLDLLRSMRNDDSVSKEDVIQSLESMLNSMLSTVMMHSFATSMSVRGWRVE